MIKRKWLIIILCMAFPIISLPLYSADGDTSDEMIKKMDREMLVRTGLAYSSLDFDVCYNVQKGDNIKETAKIEYINNSSMNMRTAVGYKDVAFFAAIPIPLDQDNKDKYGKTDYYDFQLSFYPGTLGIDLYLRRYKGFYVDNADSFSSISEAERIRPDISILNTGINLLGYFLGNCSIKSSYFQSERQQQTNAAIFMMATISYTKIAAERSMLPESIQAKYGDDYGYSGGNYYNICLGPGLGITLVPLQIFNYSKLYLSTVLCIGYGVVYKEYETSLRVKKDIAGCCEVNWRSSVGFNGDWIFWGAAFEIDCKNTRILGSGIDIMTYPGYLEIFFGTRI